MPKILVAHRSSAHRLACLSLYRALLKQSVAILAADSTSLGSIIRYRFQTDRFLQSPSQIRNGLNAGNEVLDLLCACARGEKTSIARLNSLLESTIELSQSKKAHRNVLPSSAPPSSPQLPSKASAVDLNAVMALQQPSDGRNSRPVIERPLPLAEIRGGKRRVPSFVVTQGVPFLRYSKPQSPTLGRVIGQKIAWEVKKWEQRKHLNNQLLPLGEDEDAWDALIALQGTQEGVPIEKTADDGDGDASSPRFVSWASAARSADRDLAQDIRKYDQRNCELGQKMLEILKQERVLAAKEKTESRSRQYEQTASRGTDGLQPTVPCND